MLIYSKKDNGDLKLIGEADDDGTSPALLIDLLLDQETRLRDREFRVISDDGVFDVTVNGDEPVNPRRDIAVEQVGGSAPKKTTRRKAATPAPEVEEEPEAEEKSEPTPRRRAGRKASTAKKASGTTKKAPAKRSASKPAAKKPAAKKGSPFKKNPASEGE